jgi:hypothetical protein
MSTLRFVVAVDTMKIIAACLLSMAAAVSGACRQCQKITAWKLYTSGNTTDWPIYIPPNGPYNVSTPGYFTRINNGTQVCESRTNETNWNIMMYTDPTYKATPCCGDTDNIVGDFEDLCGVIRLFKQDPSTGQFVRRGTAGLTELYWPWFFNGDDQCPLGTFSESNAFDRTVNCNPSNNIYRSKPPGAGGPGLLLPGAYMLTGSTHNGCPARPSNQRFAPTGAVLDTSIVYFSVKAGC